jgi:GT2 family glycosyltransferase
VTSAPLTPEPEVSVVIVSFNTRDDTLRCVQSLHTHTTVPLEILVADNDSRDGSVEALRTAFPRTTVLELGSNLGFATANNRALALARAPRALLLNSDAEVRPGAVESLVQALDADPLLALVGPRTLNSDGTLQLSWGRDLTPLVEWRQRRLLRALESRDPQALACLETQARSPHAPDWLSGSCLMARVAALKACGLFDAGYFLYEEDADLCLRLRRAGWRLRFEPGAVVVHHQGRSGAGAGGRAHLEYHRSHLRYYARHNGTLLTSALRLWILARAGLGWLRAAACRDLPGRTLWARIARLALVPASHIAARGNDVLR